MTSLKIKNGGSPRSIKPYSSILERSSKYTMLFLSLNTILAQYTGLELSNKALFVYKLSNSDFCDPIP
jgi:hypothetical protein